MMIIITLYLCECRGRYSECSGYWIDKGTNIWLAIDLLAMFVFVFDSSSFPTQPQHTLLHNKIKEKYAENQKIGQTWTISLSLSSSLSHSMDFCGNWFLFIQTDMQLGPFSFSAVIFQNNRMGSIVILERFFECTPYFSPDDPQMFATFTRFLE